MKRILISSCLLGRPVRYDGSAKSIADPRIALWLGEGRLVPACPELLGGLSVPRPAAEIEGGASGEDVLAGRARIVTATGLDVTAAYLEGAERTLALAERSGCVYALLTEGSPSCGRNLVHTGRFDGERAPGTGVVAARLSAAGIVVFAETDVALLAARLEES